MLLDRGPASASGSGAGSSAGGASGSIVSSGSECSTVSSDSIGAAGAGSGSSASTSSSSIRLAIRRLVVDRRQLLRLRSRLGGLRLLLRRRRFVGLGRSSTTGCSLAEGSASELGSAGSVGRAASARTRRSVGGCAVAVLLVRLLAREVGLPRPAGRPERLVLELLELGLSRATLPLQVQVLANRVVEDSHGRLRVKE